MNLSRCCQGSVDGKSASMGREAVKNLSTRQKASRWIEKLSRSYRDKFQKARWIKIAIRSVETRRRKAPIEENLSRIYQEAIELEEKKFFKEEKHKEMNATSKLLKHRSNQHISSQNNSQHIPTK